MKRLLISFFMLCILTGCGPVFKTEYRYIPPRSNVAKMCIAQCVQNKNNCEQMCQMRIDNCRSQARQEAFYQYEAYKNDRIRNHQSIDRDINYFDRSYTCTNSCNCESTYRSCYSACGGEVLERQVCVAFCDK